MNKIGCGGFYLGENLSFDEQSKTLNATGGSEIGYDELSDGNITEIGGKKYLTPLGGGVIREPLNLEFAMTATEDGYITWGEEPIVEGELIVGETYRVTVNGVTGDYACYIDEYDQKIVGTFEDDMAVGDWQIADYDGEIYGNVFGNVDDNFDFHIVGMADVINKIEKKYIPEDELYFWIQFSYDGATTTCNKTFDEVVNRDLSKPVIATFNGSPLCGDGSATGFYRLIELSGAVSATFYYIQSDNTVDVKTVVLT